MRRKKFDLFAGGPERVALSDPPTTVSKSVPPSDVWSCAACTYNNKVDKRKCKMCGKQKEGTEPITQAYDNISSGSSSCGSSSESEDETESSITEECLPRQQIKRPKPSTDEGLTAASNVLDLDNSPIQSFNRKGNSPVFEAPPPALPVPGNYNPNNKQQPVQSPISDIDLGYVEHLINTPSLSTSSFSPSRVARLSDSSAASEIVRSRQHTNTLLKNSQQVEQSKGCGDDDDDVGFQSAFTLSKVNATKPPQLLPNKISSPAGGVVASRGNSIVTTPQPLSFQPAGVKVQSNVSNPVSNTYNNNGTFNNGLQRQRVPTNFDRQNNNIIQHPPTTITNSISNNNNGFQQRQRDVFINNTTTTTTNKTLTSSPVQTGQQSISINTITEPEETKGRESIFRSGFTVEKPDKLAMSAAALIGAKSAPLVNDVATSALAMMGGDKKTRKPSAKKAAKKPGGKKTKSGKEYQPGERVFWTTVNGVRILHGSKSGIKLRGPKAYAVWKQSQEDAANGVSSPEHTTAPATATKKRAPRSKKAKPVVSADSLGGGLTDFSSKAKPKRKRK